MDMLFDALPAELSASRIIVGALALIGLAAITTTLLRGIGVALGGFLRARARRRSDDDEPRRNLDRLAAMLRDQYPHRVDRQRAIREGETLSR